MTSWHLCELKSQNSNGSEFPVNKKLFTSGRALHWRKGAEPNSNTIEFPEPKWLDMTLTLLSVSYWRVAHTVASINYFRNSSDRCLVDVFLNKTGLRHNPLTSWFCKYVMFVHNVILLIHKKIINLTMKLQYSKNSSYTRTACCDPSSTKHQTIAGKPSDL